MFSPSHAAITGMLYLFCLSLYMYCIVYYA